MATKKVIYFTAGKVPTGPELTAIANLNALAIPGYEIDVRNTLVSTDTGAGKEAADYVAGTIPAAYSAVTVIDPTKPPTPGNLPSTSAVINSGVDLTVPVTGTYATKIKATIVNGVITGFVLS